MGASGSKVLFDASQVPDEVEMDVARVDGLLEPLPEALEVRLRQLPLHRLELFLVADDVAGEVGCPNFVGGCNYVQELSLFDNCRAAVDLLGGLIACANCPEALA